MNNNNFKKRKSIGKVPLLIFGIFIGFFVGGSSAWWFSNKDFAFPFSTKLKTLFNKNFPPFNNTSNIQNKNTIKAFKKTDDSKTDDIPLYSDIDSLLFNEPALSEFYDEFGFNPDSLIFDSLLNKNYYKSEINDANTSSSYNEIIVKKDELLFSKTVEVKEYNKDERIKSDILDSVLLEAKYLKKNLLFTVEFWKSPVNFKGYKMSKNKIMIYGLAFDKNLEIQKTTNSFYLKNFDTYYVLEYSDTYKPFLIAQAPK